MKHKDSRLWFLKELGLEVCSSRGKECVCDCPHCGKENHMHLNTVKFLYHCKRCDHSGRYEQLMTQLAMDLAEDLTSKELAKLAKNRQLPVEAFEDLDIGFTGSFYTLPVRDAKGNINNVLRYKLGDKLLSAPACKMGLYGTQHLSSNRRREEPVYIMEGPWDQIAFNWLRKKANENGIVTAVLGAGNLPDNTVRLFRGRDVYIFHDNDKAGANGEARIGGKLMEVAKSIHYFQWDNKDENGKDVRDLIIEGIQ